MKAKMNSDALQRFFVEHGEKIVFGGLAAAFVYCVYSFVVHEQFDKPPEALQKLAQDADAHLQQSKLPDNPPEFKYEDPTILIQESTLAVAVGPYIHDRLFSPLGRSQSGKRSQPPLLAVNDLRVAPDFGPIAFSTLEKPTGPRKERRGGGGGGGAIQGGAIQGGAGGAAQGQPDAGPGGPGAAGGPAIGGAPGTGGGGAPGVGGGAPGVGGGAPGTGGRNRPGGGAAGGQDRQPAAANRDKLADTKALGQRWVCVTGVVPYALQQAEFNKVFRDALGANVSKDDPRYYAYLVQRAEITSDDPAAELTWVKLGSFTQTKIDKAIQHWTALGKELVDPSVTDDVLTFPLPMLLSREWGAESAHPNFVRVNETPEEPAEEEADEEAVEPDFGDDADDDQFGEAEEDEPAPAAPATRAANKIKATGNTGEKMFRFFDFTVEPGKRYRYRVKLVLHNPNYGMQASVLSDPSLAKEEYILGEWSETSPIVQVPQYGSVYVGGVKPARGAAEPKATVIVDQWQEADGVSAVRSFSLVRGQLVDFPGQTVKASDALDPSLIEDVKVDFRTATVLVDLRGGEKLPGTRATDPGEVLLLDPSGRLVIRTELDDLGQYRSLSDKLAALAGANEPEEEEEVDDEFKGMMNGGAGGGAAGGGNRRPARGE